MKEEPDVQPVPLPLLSWGAVSDTGRIRKKNQDAFLGNPDLGLFLVSDGMGGQQGGELASKVVVSVLPKIIKAHLKEVKSPYGRAIHRVFRDSIMELSRYLHEESSKQIGLKGTGATLVMTFLRNRNAYVANMGDSRAYLYRKGQLSQLTEDHSVVGILLRRGDITPEQAKTHPARGQLSRYVGMEAPVYPDVKSIALKKGDRLLLCTDGLTRMVDDETISSILHENSDPQTTCQVLINAANAIGGHDNITVLVVDWLGLESSGKNPKDTLTRISHLK